MSTVYFNMKISSTGTCIIFNGLRINIKDNMSTLISIFSSVIIGKNNVEKIHSLKG